MIKKIAVHQLRVGMYVSDFNAGWLNHPFLLNSMKIASEDEVQKVLASGIRELFIDVTRGLDVDSAPTAAEAAAHTERQIEQAATQPGARPEAPRRVSLAEEMSRARGAFTEATRMIRGIMDDIRLGRQLELDSARPVIEKVTASVVRNSSAMMTLRRMKSLDDYTFVHSVSVCTMLASFCHALEFDPAAIHDAALGGLLHDVGKMRVNQGVLNKPARLSEEEFTHIKSHVVLGCDVLRQLPGLPALALAVAEQHHERYDGSGYPRGLAGAAIDRIGRMAAIVDVYDAITSDRAYRPGLNPADAIRRLFEWSKHHFDPELVQVFMKSVGIYPVGALVRLESGRLGVVIEQREKSLLTPVVRVVFDARRNYYVKPEDIDLSRPVGHGGGDRILGSEPPARWGIDVSRFLAA